MKLLPSLRLSSVWWVAAATGSSLVLGEEQHQPPPQQQDCIAPQVLQECHTAREMHQKEASLLTEKLATVEAHQESQQQQVANEWTQKLNLAVQTAQTEHQTQLERLRAEHANALQEAQRQVQAASEGSQSELQALQQQVQQHQQAVTQAEATCQNQLAEQQSAHSQTVNDQVEKAVLEANQQARTAHDQALEKKQKEHDAAVKNVKRQKTLVENELKELKTKTNTLERQYKRSTDDLLKARQDLLEANEIVRLYKLGWHNRWIVLPVTAAYGQLYQHVLEPVGSELYAVLKEPVLDPLYETVGVPLQTHVLEPLAPHVQPVWAKVQTHAATTYHFVLYTVTVEVPQQIQAFVVFASPHVQRAAVATYQGAGKAYQHAQTVHQEHVHPKVVVPLKDAWNQKVQPVLLEHFTKAAKSLHKAVKKQKGVPKPIVETTKLWATKPQLCLERLQLFCVTVFFLFVVRWLLSGIGARNKKKAADNKKKPGKANNNKPTNGAKPPQPRQVHIQEPPKRAPPNGGNGAHFQTPPPRTNKHKPHHGRRATPYPKDNQNTANKV